MNILMSGASGLVGSHLKTMFSEQQYAVTALGRDDFSGSTEAMAQKVSQADIVIHLAGAPIIARWTKAHKKAIYHSRIDTTHMLVQAIELAVKKPQMLISTSAVGIYADGAVNTEKDAHLAEGFLSEVCQRWEAEALAARPYTKVAIFRFGIILARDGGALKQMLPPFKLGLGGPIAGGKQGFSWIHIDDLLKANRFVIDRKADGIFNLTAPQITDNALFTKELGAALNRPAVMPVPAFGLRLAYGEGASSLTTGQKVLPERLLNEGFEFSYPDLKKAFGDLIS
ncbi:MAG: TIGR01777 family oxidoreductase [Lentimicrobiaceae bacterium]|nr:TIGR01777 family oxidoreductase [Lentimicrobiaceae bacterium]